MRIEAIVDKLRKTAATSGPSGMFTLGLAAIDIALWDIKGKALSQPVSRLLGGYRERLPTYASGALLRNHPFSHLEQMGPRLVEMGFKQMKAQAGADASVRASGERIRVMRQAIGPDIDLMVDINQLWNVHQAIEGGKYFEECNLFWMEDPVAPDDYQGLARVADALTTPIATGEYVYGITPFRQMLEQRSLDIVMVDVVRAGGITQFMKIAGMAQAFNLPVVSHLVPEIQVHLISAIPNGLTVEYMPWTLQFWEETPQIENGQIVVPDKPGLGLNFDQKALAKYEVK
jgi:L-alanine-DL-glutamate epimerase-like enolase superfamily enzyme